MANRGEGIFRVIIAGTRTFSDYELLERHVRHMLSRKSREEVEIVSGGAAGADRLGERFARENGYKLRVFPADWERYGRRAGILRNQQMVDYADALIAFHDGQSRGTAHVIAAAREAGLLVSVKVYSASWR